MAELTQSPTPGSAVSSTPPGTNPPAPTSPPAAPVTATAGPIRIGNDSPYEWARGRTVDEALAVTNTLMQSVGQPFRQQQAPVQQQAAPATPPPVQIDLEGYVTGAQAQAIQRDALAQFTSGNEVAIGLAASGNLSSVRREHAREFAKYGPEIMAKLAYVPKKDWNVDNLETIVKLVQVDHLDEIAGERAQQLASQMEPTMRSIGGAGSAPVQPTDPTSFKAQWEKLPPEWRLKAEKDGITESVVQEFVRGNDGMTVQDFFKNFGSTAIGEGAAR